MKIVLNFEEIVLQIRKILLNTSEVVFNVVELQVTCFDPQMGADETQIEGGRHLRPSASFADHASETGHGHARML
jgi:hypothetical protein